MASALQVDITNLRQNDYVSLVVFTAVGYDYILTFPKEIEYIWNKPWTRVSTIFIFSRYFGLCNVMMNALAASSFIPDPTKLVLYLFSTWAMFVFAAAAEMAMILRVWVMCNQSRLILIAFLSFYAIEMVLFLVIFVILSTQITVVVTQVLDSSLCTMHDDSSVLAEIVDIVLIILGALMCLLIFLRFIKESLTVYNATKRFSMNRYMYLLAREGLIYFLAILAYALTAMLFDLAIVPLDGWSLMLLAPLHYVPTFTLVPRLILDLRELYARDLRGRHGNIDTAFGLGFGSGRDVVSTMAFADVPQDGEERVDERQIEMRGQEYSAGTSSA